MSWGMKGAMALVLVIVLAGLEWKVYLAGKHAGMAEVQQKWDRQMAAAEQAVRAEEESRHKVIVKTVTKFVEKAAQERVVYRDIIREVAKYVPSDLPMLPGSFRVLHDAAATGSPLPEAGDSGGVDGAAVSPENVAKTIASNYASCREDQLKLSSLQEIIMKNSVSK
jgi:hypothetical protein